MIVNKNKTVIDVFLVMIRVVGDRKGKVVATL